MSGGNSIQNINGYRIHTFTTVGTSTFTPARAGNVEVLVIAGGGSGGVRHGGGGGAGGYVYNSSFSVSGPVTVTVGDGGAARLGSSGGGSGNSGANSVFGSLTAIGGGYGSQADNTTSGSGGSSGGVWNQSPRGTAFQGFQGGTGSGGGEEFQYQGGGGGGAGAVGQSWPGATGIYRGGNGGAGLPFSVSGTSTYYMGGGGGSTVTMNPSTTGGIGGLGGGGAGGGYVNGDGIAGTPNTGGGGGAGGFSGGTNYSSGKGGSGIVIVRYALVAPRSDCQLAISNPVVYKGTAAVNYGSGPGVSNRELQGTATITYGGAPTSNTALSLPGTSGSVMNLGTFFPSRANPSTSNIYVEAWIYLPTGATGMPFTVSDSSTEDMGFLVNYSTSALQFRVWNTGGSGINSDGNGAALASATWYHIAGSFDRTNNRVYGFVNGVVGSTVGVFSGTARARSSSNMTIGAGNSGTFFPFNGYIRDFRMVQGGIVPTTSFTPAQALFRLNAPSYVTGGSTVLSLAEQYFTPSWVNFPGPTGNYLNLNPTPAIFDLATDNMFVECWYYAKGNGGGGTGNLHQILAGGGPVINVDQMWGLYLFFTPNNSVGFYVNNNAGGSTTATLSATLNYNTWYHVAVSWNSSTKAMYVFLNGSASALTTFSGTNRAYSSSYGVYVGADFDRNTSNGYIQDLRIIRGGSVPTSSFTPAAAPFVNTATPASLFGQLPLAAQNVAVGAFSLRAVNGTSVKAVNVVAGGTFPPSAMTQTGTNSSTQTLGTGGKYQGSYTASSSRSDYGWGASGAFTLQNTGVGPNIWQVGNYPGGGGSLSTPTTTTTGATNYNGEWLQFRTPFPINLTGYSAGTNFLTSAVLLASTTGASSSWILVDSKSSITVGSTITNTGLNFAGYSYFRFVLITSTTNYPQLGNVRFFGTVPSLAQDFYADLSGNLSVLGTGQSLASWLGGATGYVATWYDQSGAGNHAVQTNTANQPIIQRGSRGPGYMCLYSGSQGLTFGAYNLLNNTNYTTCGVVRRTSTIGNNYYLCGQDGVNNTDQKFHSGYRSSTQLALAQFGDDTDLTVPAFLASSTEPMAYNYLMLGTGRSGRLYSYSSGALYSTTRTYTAYLNHAVGTSFSIGNGLSTFTGEIYEILVFTNSLYDLDNTGGLITQVYNNQVSMYGPYVSGGTTVLSLATQYYQTSMRLASAGTIQLTNRPILTPVLTGLVGAPSVQVGSTVTIYQTAVQPANGITWSFSPTGAGLSIASLSDYALTLTASSSVISQRYTVTATNKNSLTTITQFTTTGFGGLSSAAAASAVGVYSLRSLISLYARVVNIRNGTTSATQDFYADALGNLTTLTGGSGETLVSWLAGATGFVATLYDQSVNGYNLAQPTTANQPPINLTTTPYSMIFDGSNLWLYNASVPLNMGAGSFTLRYVVSNNTGGNILYKAIGTSFSWSSGEKSFWLGNGSNTEGARGNFPAFVGNGQNFVVSSTGITASVKNSVVHKANATNSVPIYVNGVQASLVVNNISMSNDPGNFLIIGRGGANSNYIGNMFELELFSTRLSDADRLALEN